MPDVAEQPAEPVEQPPALQQGKSLLGFYIGLGAVAAVVAMGVVLWKPLHVAYIERSLSATKPGFYDGHSPEFRKISEYENMADIAIYLSGHDGISLPPSTSVHQRDWLNNLSLQALGARLDGVPHKRIASIIEEQNLTQQDLRAQVVELLLKSGFKNVIVTGVHSSGVFLEEFIRTAPPEPKP